jgi:hypothetical protein
MQSAIERGCHESCGSSLRDAIARNDGHELASPDLAMRRVGTRARAANDERHRVARRERELDRETEWIVGIDSDDACQARTPHRRRNRGARAATRLLAT